MLECSNSEWHCHQIWPYKHVSKVCSATATCPAIDSESAATLVHARPFTLCSVPSRRNPLTKGRYQAVPVSTDLRFVVDRSACFQVRVSGKSTASQQVIRPENWSSYVNDNQAFSYVDSFDVISCQAPLLIYADVCIHSWRQNAHTINISLPNEW